MACAPSEDSGQTGHTQADLSLRWAHIPFFFGGGGTAMMRLLRSQSSYISINRLSATAEGYRNSI